MRIGDVAGITGVSSQTIRFYEREGLLPSPTREANGYRAYENGTVARVGFIRAAQAAGLRLTEIAGVLELREAGQTPCRQVRALLTDKLAEVRERQEGLARMESELVRMIEASQTLDPATCSTHGICDVIPQ